jgi:hypothetical protein
VHGEYGTEASVAVAEDAELFGSMIEPPSVRERSAKQTRANVEEMARFGRRVTEQSEDNPFDVTDSLRDGLLPEVASHIHGANPNSTDRRT